MTNKCIRQTEIWKDKQKLKLIQRIVTVRDKKVSKARSHCIVNEGT